MQKSNSDQHRKLVFLECVCYKMTLVFALTFQQKLGEAVLQLPNDQTNHFKKKERTKTPPPLPTLKATTMQ